LSSISGYALSLSGRSLACDLSWRRSSGGNAADATCGPASSTEAVVSRRRRRRQGLRAGGEGGRCGGHGGQILVGGAVRRRAVRPARTDARVAAPSSFHLCAAVDEVVPEGDALLGETLGGLGVSQFSVRLRSTTEHTLQYTDTDTRHHRRPTQIPLINVHLAELKRLRPCLFSSVRRIAPDVMSGFR